MADSLSKLRVSLELSTSAFSAGFRRALGITKSGRRGIEAELRKLGKSAGDSFKKLTSVRAGLAGVAAMGGAVRVLERAAGSLDTIAKTGAKLGVSTDYLQELQVAGELAGVAVNTTNMALQRLVRRTAEAAQGTGEARAALHELGIPLRDMEGRMRPVEQLLDDIADALAHVEDPADRVRLAFKLFDSEGVAFVNVLQRGSAALAETRAQARSLGLVMDRDTLVAAERVTDQVGLMKTQIARGWSLGAIRGASAVFGDIDELLSDGTLVRRASQLSETFFRLFAFVAQNAPTIVSVFTALKGAAIGARLGPLAALLGAVGGGALGYAGTAGLLGSATAAGAGGAGGSLAAIADRIEPAKGGGGFVVRMGTDDLKTGRLAPRVPLSEFIRARQTPPPVVTPDPTSVPTLPGGRGDDFNPGAAAREAEYAALVERYRELEAFGRQAAESVATAEERYAAAVEKSNAAVVAGHLDLQTRDEYLTGLREELGLTTDKLGTLKEAAGAALGGLASAFLSAAARGQKLGDVFDNLLGQLADVIAQQLILRPLLAGTEQLLGLGAGVLSGGYAGRANGGPIGSGRMYQVGEYGRELVSAPPGGAYVHSNAALAKAPAAGAGGGVVINNIHRDGTTTREGGRRRLSDGRLEITTITELVTAEQNRRAAFGQGGAVPQIEAFGGDRAARLPR